MDGRHTNEEKWDRSQRKLEAHRKLEQEGNGGGQRARTFDYRRIRSRAMRENEMQTGVRVGAS
jgi:hypothetical protein